MSRRMSNIVKRQQCPMLLKCKSVGGIDCTDRDYKQCDFYKKLMNEVEHYIRDFVEKLCEEEFLETFSKRVLATPNRPKLLAEVSRKK